MGGNQQQTRQVLTEETFASVLSVIVKRDFFPDIPALELQSTVLEGRRNGDAHGPTAARRIARFSSEQEYERARREQREEIHFGTISSSDDKNGISKMRKRPRSRPLHRESLSGFHARATSIENHSFLENHRRDLSKQREKLEAKYLGIHKSDSSTDGSSVSALSPTSRAKCKLSASPLNALASDDFEPESNWKLMSERSAAPLTNSLFHMTPEIQDQALKSEASADDASRRDSMPPPPARTDDALTRKYEQNGNSPFQKKVTIKHTSKYPVEPSVNSAGTRMPNYSYQPRRTLLSHYNPVADDIGEESDSDAEDSYTDASTDLDESPAMSLQAEREARMYQIQKEQPRLVCAVPNNIFMRGSHGLQTDNSGEGQLFTISENNSRDLAAYDARSILRKRSKRAKAIKQRAKKSPKQHRASGKSSLHRAAFKLLTPAALTHMQLKSGATTTAPISSRSRHAFSSALRQSYTPRLPSSRVLSAKNHASHVTPLVKKRRQLKNLEG